MRHKVSVIGAGNVGGAIAQYMAEKDIADIVLIDINEGLAKGKALDLFEAAPVRGYSSKLVGSSDYKEIENSSVVAVTAGLARKPGMTREDLLHKNAEIISGIAENIKKYAPEAFVIIVTNPLDVMTYVTNKVTGFSKNKVIGMAGVLDASRFSSFVSEKLNVNPKDVQAMVLGGHGDTMVPVAEYATVAGVPLNELMDQKDIDEIIERTKNAGAEIVGHLKTGSAFYSPAASAVVMIESILTDKKRIASCSVFLNGEYGLKDLCLGVPILIGAEGVEKIVELKLSESSKEALKKSAAVVEKNINLLKL